MSLITGKQYADLESEKIAEAAPEIVNLLGDADLGVFAQYSSWAIYPDVSVKPQAAAQAPSAVNTYGAVEGIAHNNVVLVAYNLGRPKNPKHGAGVGRSHHDADRLWENFHSGSRDFNIARGTQGNAFRGAYITDFFKGLPTNDIGEFRALLRSRGAAWTGRVEKAMHAILERELSLIGAGRAPLVAFSETENTGVAEVLRKFYDRDRVHHVSHYADAVGLTYHEEFEVLAERLKLTSRN